MRPVQSSEFIRAKKQANRLGKPYKPLPTSIGQQRLGEAWAVATLEDGTLAEPACSALAEYRWATFRLEVLFFLITSLATGRR